MRINQNVIASLAFLSLAAGAAAEDTSGRFYQAIRTDDQATLRTLLKTADANTRDQRDTTPLMYASAFGSIGAMRLLMDAGADVNAINAVGATALMWCAGDLAKARLLVEKGADVDARSKLARTPLMVAAAYDGNSEVVKLLIDKGADVSARDKSNSSPFLEAIDANDNRVIRMLIEKGADPNVRTSSGYTPLMIASSYGNLDIMRWLLARRVEVNAATTAESVHVKKGPIALGNLTALMLAAPYGGHEAVKLLLNAGAKVNEQDVRGMTPLMLAIGTDRPDPEVIHLLLAHGADINIKSKGGETALDWARKFNDSSVMRALGLKVRTTTAPVFPPASRDAKRSEARTSSQKGIELLQKTAHGFLMEGGCASCHAQNLTGLALSVAGSKALSLDQREAAEGFQGMRSTFVSFEQALLQRVDLPGSVDGADYALLQLSDSNPSSDHLVDVLVHNIAAKQRLDGSWHDVGTARPPMEDGDFSRTALAIRALSLHVIPARKAEFDQRIQRAAAWLTSANPRTTEDRSMQLLGLRWSKADPGALETRLAELIALHRADGGWGQTPDLDSDAYATGMVLYTMHELGVPTGASAYQQGILYLVHTQLADGSWHVASRSPKFQPYFQSGFPYGHDQWISSAGTAWATIGLTYAIEYPVVSANSK